MSVQDLTSLSTSLTGLSSLTTSLTGLSSTEPEWQSRYFAPKRLLKQKTITPQQFNYFVSNQRQLTTNTPREPVKNSFIQPYVTTSQKFAKDIILERKQRGSAALQANLTEINAYRRNQLLTLYAQELFE